MILDPATLKSLYETAGADYIAALLAECITESVRLLAEVEFAVAQRDVTVLRRVVHSLRGQSLLYGADSFAEQCLKLELMARSGSLEGAEEQFARIKSDFPSVLIALEAELQKASS
jgi:HPt (histidine-containing phosphotransfer) domain-containing protein